jgi:hypothetical protein
MRHVAGLTAAAAASASAADAAAAAAAAGEVMNHVMVEGQRLKFGAMVPKVRDWRAFRLVVTCTHTPLTYAGVECVHTTRSSFIHPLLA